jgi:hypothetical protein
MLVQVPYVIPSWCLEALKRRFKFSPAAGSGGLPKSLFTVVAVLLKARKLKLRDVLLLLAAEFDALPVSADSYEPFVTAMAEAGKPAPKGLFSDQIDLDVTARDAGTQSCCEQAANCTLCCVQRHSELCHVHHRRCTLLIISTFI